MNDSPIVSAAIVDPEKSIQIINTDVDSSSKEDILDLDDSTLGAIRGDINPNELKSLELIDFDYTKDYDKKDVAEIKDNLEKSPSSGQIPRTHDSSSFEQDIKTNELLGPLELKERPSKDLETPQSADDMSSTHVSQIDAGIPIQAKDVDSTPDNNLIIDTDEILEESNENLDSIASSLDLLVGLLQGIQLKTDRMFHNVSDTIGKFFADGKKLLLSVAPTPKPPPRDCTDIAADGFNTSDTYIVTPDGDSTTYKVFCDLESDGGGWTVFQRRFDGSVDFYRDWGAYEHGFGKPHGEHWAGLDMLHALTKTGTWELLVQLEDFNGNLGFAHYASFRVADRDSGYRLSVGAYDGTVGDAMTSDNHNRQFSTPDRDNDWRSWGNCAQYRKGAWWYGSCSSANLNGVYLGPKKVSDTGLYWWKWKHSYEVLKGSEMKLRRTM